MNLKGISGNGYNLIVNSVLNSLETSVSPDISKMLDSMGNTVHDVLGTIIKSAPMQEIREKVLTPIVENSEYLNELGVVKVWTSMLKMFCSMQKEVYNRIIYIREELIAWVRDY